MHKGYQMIADSAVLRTDEDEITSQTDLMGVNQVAVVNERQANFPINKNTASYGSFGRTLLHDECSAPV